MAQFNIDQALEKMNSNREDYKAKGTAGEEAALAVLQQYQEIRGGLIYHSYTYPYAADRHGIFYAGNIYLKDGKYEEVKGKVGMFDEIDLLYITNCRIFVIEVKARGGSFLLYDHWMKQNGRLLDKSCIAQTEKHCRHLYHSIYEYLPRGLKEYIVPMVVFVDKAKVVDSRSARLRREFPVAILNNLKEKLVTYDIPLANSIDLEDVALRLKNIGTGRLYK